MIGSADSFAARALCRGTRKSLASWAVHAIACLLLTAALMGSTAVSALSRPLSDAERTSLNETVEAFAAATRGSNFKKVLDFMSPRILTLIADKAGIGVDKLRSGMIKQMEKAFKVVKLESFSMRPAEADIRQLKNGKPYALVPTKTVIDMGEKGRIAQTSYTLALLSDKKWFLVRIADLRQIAMLREAHPDFAGVEFPRGTVRMLKK